MLRLPLGNQKAKNEVALSETADRLGKRYQKAYDVSLSTIVVTWRKLSGMALWRGIACGVSLSSPHIFSAIAHPRRSAMAWKIAAIETSVERVGGEELYYRNNRGRNIAGGGGLGEEHVRRQRRRQETGIVKEA
jgi:hypothetical protein